MLANFLSVLRVLLIPFLLYFIAQGPAAQLQAVLLLLIAGATDIGDGWVARHYDQVSRLGKILDPLADKIFLACLLGALVHWRDLPLWLLAMLLVRDLAIVLVGGGALAFTGAGHCRQPLGQIHDRLHGTYGLQLCPRGPVQLAHGAEPSRGGLGRHLQLELRPSRAQALATRSNLKSVGLNQATPAPIGSLVQGATPSVAMDHRQHLALQS